jgi:hypothetical protein
MDSIAEYHAFGPSQTSAPTSLTQTTPISRNRHYHSIGYLGPTSFSAIFLENHESSNIPESLKELSAGPEPVVVSDADLDQGAEVLLVFWRCLPLCSKVHRGLYAAWDVGVVFESLVEIWCDEANQLFDGANAQSSEVALSEKCRAVSRSVWQNSSREDLIDESVTMQLWARGFTGYQLRWEVIGTVSRFAASEHALLLTTTDFGRDRIDCKQR